jgi:hypothetical protein
VNQYTSPEPDVESTSTERSSSSSEESSESSRSSDEERGTPDEAKRDPIEAAGTCDDRSCVSTSDCCKGYQCSFDPERSKVIRYCMEQ